MKKFKILIALLAAVSGLSLNAAINVVTVANSATKVFNDSSGSLLSANSIVRVGLFDTSGGNLDIIRNSTSFAELDALFSPLGEGAAGGGSPTVQINANGDLQGSIMNIDLSYAAQGSQIYMWAWNQDNTVVGPDTEWAIVTNALWTIPPDNTARSLVLTQVTNSPDDVLRGSFGNNAIQLEQLSLEAVPEPSTYALMCLGAISLFFVSRRANPFEFLKIGPMLP